MKNMLPEYVDELKPYDVDMLEQALSKNAKDYPVSNFLEAKRLIGELVDQTIRKAGVTITPDDTAKTIEKSLKKHKIKVEHRVDYKEDDIWRNGIYVYKDMELLGFASEPLWKKPSPLEINQTPKIVIRVAMQ